jgi:predicted RNase H-like HicB family nuclease
MIVTVVIEQGPNNWGAHAPDLEDCVISTGDTREETISRFRDALRGLIQYKHEEGLPAPDVTGLEIRETVAA